MSNHFKVVLLGAIVAGATTGSARADVLYDNRASVVGGTWDSRGFNYIGGDASGPLRDGQYADDFVLSNPAVVTTIVTDLLSDLPDSVPANGFLVEFFPDAGGVPSEVPAYSISTMAFTRLGSFLPSPGSFAQGTEANRSTWGIDLSGTSIELAAGSWWISAVPVDHSPFGDRYRWVGTIAPSEGVRASIRNAGADHGNGYGPAIGGGATDWTFQGPPNSSAPGGLSVRIEGVVIPTPSAIGAFAVAGVLCQRRRR